MIDFGIARSSGDATLTATGLVIGTPEYLSPEVAAGAPADVASDAWQLAATESYALTGQPPRGRHEDVVSALAAAQHQPPTQLPEQSAHLRLLRRALHPDPAQRPSLADVQAELGQWLRDTGRPADGPVTMRLAYPPAGAARAEDGDEDHPHRGSVRH
jgi:serine/threonine protein kinase